LSARGRLKTAKGIWGQMWFGFLKGYDEKTSHPQYIKGILRSRMMDKRLGVQVG